MKCAWVQDRLLLYLAGEMEPLESAALCRHLQNCDRCTAVAEELTAIEALVEGALATTVSAPVTLDARVMAALRQQPTPAPSSPRLVSPAVSSRHRSIVPAPRGWKRALAAASMVVSLLIGGYVAGHWHAARNRTRVTVVTAPARPTLALALLGNDHLKYLANPQPAQVLGPDPGRVSRGLTALLEFPVAAVDLRSEDARLLGGRKCQVHGVPIAFLLYDWNGERVSLYQIDGRKIALPSLREVAVRQRRFQVGEADGLSYVAWRSGAMHFVMVSGVKPERLLRLARCASGMSESA
jgi:anti-sigma factor RsiW